MKILDCTLRDGGYYTNWDFPKELVDVYIESFNRLPVDYLEVGYRSKKMDGYLGEYFYLPVHVMEALRDKCNKELVIILNEKDIRVDDIDEVLSPCVGFISMVRLAIDPKNFQRAIELAKGVKAMGFKVGFNVMYMSNWKEHQSMLDLLPQINGIADYFYMVDSFGGVFPSDVREIYGLVKERVDVPIGFHGHNNLEMALANTIEAIECGADIVDATITGMGRGAGNLKTELLLTYLNEKGLVEVNFNALSKVVDPFSALQNDYGWGTSLPYMVSGAYSLPQKQVMEWVTKRYYSFNSILRALDNQSKGRVDNRQLPNIEFNDVTPYDKALIVGGGNSVRTHEQAITKFLASNERCVVIHASSRNAMMFNNVSNDQYFCLVGNEGHRLDNVFKGVDTINGKCVLPPYPRKMGTYIPPRLEDLAYELHEVDFTDKLKDTHTSLALQTARELKVKEVYMVGYDGYANTLMDTKSQELFKENEYLFEKGKSAGLELVSLTPTMYESINHSSVYASLQTEKTKVNG